MMLSLNTRTITTFIVFLLFSMYSVAADTNVDFLSADQAFEFNHVEVDGKLNVTINIAPNYYLYKNKIKVLDAHKNIIDVALPDGTSHTDEYFGIQQIYQQRLAFSLSVPQHLAQQKTPQEPPQEMTITYQGCAEMGLCYSPQTKTINVSSANIKQANATAELDLNTVESDSDNFLSDILENESLLWILMMFFLLGLGLSFTPCVFPMYPILTSIIVGQGSKTLSLKKAFLLSFSYVQGMALTYTALGIVVAFAGMQFQAAFQHPAVLIGLSVLFIVLALSMFGIFNFSLPSSWQEKLNSMSNTQKGGSYLGVGIMGVISGLVASPCTTAPLTAALLYIAQTGDVILGASALYALSLGMGVPLIILGTTGGKLLPKAGAWMDVIKNIFGFILLVVPVVLLQRLIPDIATDILWVILGLVFSTYLYVNNTNSNSKSGFWFGLRSLVVFLCLFFFAQQALNLVMPKTQQQVNEIKHRFTKITSLEALQQEIKSAKQMNKSVIVDLYADWCIACKEFEKYTFNDALVQKSFENSVLLQIDLTDSSSDSSIEFMNYYNVLGLPTLLIFNNKGEEIVEARVTGFLKAKPFSQHLNRYLN